MSRTNMRKNARVGFVSVMSARRVEIRIRSRVDDLDKPSWRAA